MLSARRKRTTFRLALVGVIASTALAGCSTTNDYVDTVNEAQDEVLQAAQDLGADPNASKRDILASLEEAEAKAQEAVSQLNDVDIPDGAEEGHAELVDGFADLSALITSVRDKVENQSGNAFSELRAEGADIDRRIDAAIDQINSDLGLE
jgi:outer membrane murein-binding lipoprotein Lpp